MTSIYSFFIVFLMLLALILNTYISNRKTYDIYKQDIKERLSKNEGLLSEYNVVVCNWDETNNKCVYGASIK